MRQVSTKRQRRMKEAKPVRLALINKHKECMVCRRSPQRPHRNKPPECSLLCCHEIANGPDRDAALDKPFAILVLCWYCNGYELTNKGRWPQARQLALLQKRAPDDYDLTAFNFLVNPRAPLRITPDEVAAFLDSV